MRKLSRSASGVGAGAASALGGDAVAAAASHTAVPVRPRRNEPILAVSPRSTILYRLCVCARAFASARARVSTSGNFCRAKKAHLREKPWILIGAPAHLAARRGVYEHVLLATGTSDLVLEPPTSRPKVSVPRSEDVRIDAEAKPAKQGRVGATAVPRARRRNAVLKQKNTVG